LISSFIKTAEGKAFFGKLAEHTILIYFRTALFSIAAEAVPISRSPGAEKKKPLPRIKEKYDRQPKSPSKS
jgi:hypothetical protein